MHKATSHIASWLILASLAVSAAVPSLIQNEYDFAQAASKDGVRKAFLMYLDKQAITLVPLPANAYEVYTNRKPNSTQLTWYPSYALLSSSGDFGVDTGPWTASWVDGGKRQRAYGQWLTIWHKTKDGRWRILFDGGVDHAKPAKPEPALARSAKVIQLPRSGPAPGIDQVHWSLERAETVFSNTGIESGPYTAYAGQADPDIRLLEEGKQPVSGLSAVLHEMSNRPGTWQWVPAGGSVSTAADLAYLYGEIYAAKDDAHKLPLGGYMHVWRHTKGGWKLLIDLEPPVAPQKK